MPPVMIASVSAMSQEDKNEVFNYKRLNESSMHYPFIELCEIMW